MSKDGYPTINVGEILIDRWNKADKITAQLLVEMLSYGLHNNLFDANSEVSLVLETVDGDRIVGTLNDIDVNETIKYDFSTSCNNEVRVKGLDLISKMED